MTKRELAEMHLYELYNVADHVDQNTQIARHDIKYSPAGALEALERARESVGRIEMHYSDAIQALRALVADPDQPDHPGYAG